MIAEQAIIERLDKIEQMLVMIIGAPPSPPPPTEAKPRTGTLKARIAAVLEERDRKQALRKARA